MIYADFESIIVPEDNEKQIRMSTNKYQIHVAWGCSKRLVYIDDKFIKSCLSEDAVYNLLNSMLKESKYCSDMIK